MNSRYNVGCDLLNRWIADGTCDRELSKILLKAKISDSPISISMRRCAICGAETDYEICPKCYLERYTIYEFNPYIEIKVCPKCGRAYSGKWIDKETALMDTILKNFTHDLEFKILRFELEELGENNGLIRVEGVFRGEKLTYELPFELRQKFEVCERCSRLYGGYFESIIQLRAENRAIEEYEVERARSLIDESIEKADYPTAFISKIVERKEGIDYYIGDRNLAKKIARRIEEELGGKLTESKKISGRKDGRDIYRTTYSIRLREYRNGDVVRDGTKILLVTNAVKGKGVDLSGKSHVLKNPKVIAKKEHVKRTFVVNVDKSVVEVLNPTTQEVVQVEKRTDHSIGEEVLYFEDKGKPYIFPEL